MITELTLDSSAGAEMVMYLPTAVNAGRGIPVTGGRVYAVTLTGVPASTLLFVVKVIVVLAVVEKSRVVVAPEIIAVVIWEPDPLGLAGAYVAAVGPVTVSEIRVTAV
jgi:hypothetical protein